MGFAKKALKEGIWLGGKEGSHGSSGISLLEHEVGDSHSWDWELLEHRAWHGQALGGVCPNCPGNKPLDGGSQGGAARSPPA